MVIMKTSTRKVCYKNTALKAYTVFESLQCSDSKYQDDTVLVKV